MESGTCTSSYNCTIGAMCSAFAASYPEDLPYYTNNYTGDTAATYGCPQQVWTDIQFYAAPSPFRSTPLAHYTNHICRM